MVASMEIFLQDGTQSERDAMKSVREFISSKRGKEHIEAGTLTVHDHGTNVVVLLHVLPKRDFYNRTLYNLIFEIMGA